MQRKVKRDINLLKTLVCTIFIKKSLIQAPNFKSCPFNGKIGRSAFPKWLIGGLLAETPLQKFTGYLFFSFHS